jgi:magnesium chelatase family protein
MQNPWVFELLALFRKDATQVCPCGFWNDSTRECRCTPLQIQRYVGRISGPLLDRIDIHIDLPAVRFKDLSGEAPPDSEGSSDIRERVVAARDQQHERLKDEGIFANAAMTPRQIRRYCKIDSDGETLLESAMVRQGLSARAYDRILKACHYPNLFISQRIKLHPQHF